MSAELNPPAAGIRAWLAAQLQPLLPDEWVIVPGIAGVKTLLVPAVYFEYTAIEKTTGWPPGHVRTVLDMVIVDPHTDLVKGEDGVDELVVELIVAIDKHDSINWSSAKKQEIADSYFGWRVSVSAFASTPKE